MGASGVKASTSVEASFREEVLSRRPREVWRALASGECVTNAHRAVWVR